MWLVTIVVVILSNALLLQCSVITKQCDTSYSEALWAGGIHSKLQIPIESKTSSWQLNVAYSAPITSANFFQGEGTLSNDMMEAHVESRDWASEQEAGTVFETQWITYYDVDGEVEITTLMLTLDYANGTSSKCEVDLSPQMCSGAFNQTFSGKKRKEGNILIVSDTDSSNFHNMQLSFSAPIKKAVVKPKKKYQIHCWNDNMSCTISENKTVPEVAGKLITIWFKMIFVSDYDDTMITRMIWKNVDVCNVVPEPDDEPTQPPTGTTTPSSEETTTTQATTSEETTSSPGGKSTTHLATTSSPGGKSTTHLATTSSPSTTPGWETHDTTTPSSTTTTSREWITDKGSGTMTHTAETTTTGPATSTTKETTTKEPTEKQQTHYDVMCEVE